MNFSDLYNQSINDKQAFWGEQAKRIYWHQQPTQILDDSKLPFAKWFVGGETNLCYNMVDRHLKTGQSKMPLCGSLPKSMLK